MFTKARFILSTLFQVLWAALVMLPVCQVSFCALCDYLSLKLCNNPERKDSFCTVKEIVSTAKKAMLGLTDVEWVDQGTRSPVAREGWKCEAVWVLGTPRVCLSKGPVLTHPLIREQKGAGRYSIQNEQRPNTKQNSYLAWWPLEKDSCLHDWIVSQHKESA